MAAPKTTIWNIEPHTRAKHEILRRYLQAWTPILSLGGFPEISYIDGLAGPGKYSGGEDGSPIIAIHAVLDQSVQISATVRFFFVEKDLDRAEALKSFVDEIELPDNLKVRVFGGETFEDAYPKILQFYESIARPVPPTFAFIDPFGWTGAPFWIVRHIMENSSCEVFVTFMYEEINRFIGHPDQETNFDSFFGTTEWRSCIEIPDPRSRNRCLHDLYASQLREDAGATFVRSFEMRNERDVTDYYLFYGTKNLKGLTKMKEAMWKVDERGEFSFSDATDPNQLVLIASEPQFDVLERQIVGRFVDQVVTIGEIERFVLAETAFRETHYKTQVLRPMEKASPPLITAVGAPGNRTIGTYADPNLRLLFSATP